MAAKKKSKPSKPIEVVGESMPESSDSTTPVLVLARDIYPENLPVIPVVGRPMFPRLNAPVLIDNPELVTLLTERIKARQKYVAVVLRKDAPPGTEPSPQPAPGEMYSVGVVAEILQANQPSEDTIQILVSTHERLRIVSYLAEKPVLIARVEYLFEPDMSDNAELKAYSISVVQAIKTLVQLNPLHKEELALLMQHGSLSEPGRLADIAAALTSASAAEQQEILETVNVRDRLDKVLVMLHKEIGIARIKVKIGAQVEEKISKNQREFFLREQLRAIKDELGIEKEGKTAEIERLLARVEKLKLTDEARERFDEELAKLRLIEPHSPEFSVTRNYLDWLTALPWGIFTRDQMDLKRAAKMLDEDHYGLEDVKERILEFLAVGILKGGISGSILCFWGRPASARPRWDARSPAPWAATTASASAAARRGRDQGAPPHLHRRPAGQADPGDEALQERQPRHHDRRDRQDRHELPGRPRLGPARGARPRAEHRIPRPLSGRALRPAQRLLHLHGQPARHDPACAARPHGGHQSGLLHHAGEARDRAALLYPRAARRAVSAGTDPHHDRRPAAHHRRLARANRACAASRSRSPRSCARRRGVLEKGDSSITVGVEDVEKLLGRPLFTDDPNVTRPGIGVALGLA